MIPDPSRSILGTIRLAWWKGLTIKKLSPFRFLLHRLVNRTGETLPQLLNPVR